MLPKALVITLLTVTDLITAVVRLLRQDINGSVKIAFFTIYNKANNLTFILNVIYNKTL